MPYEEMDILTRGQKAVEGFYPVPFQEVDKTLRAATKRTGDTLKEGLRERAREIEENYG